MWKYLGLLPFLYLIIKLLTLENWLRFSVLLFANAVLNKFLKHIIQQPRPKMYASNDYGMPSGHSQNTWFMIAYCFSSIKNIYFKVFSLLFGFIVSFQRIKVKRHTVEQVVVGALIGSMLGYYASTNI